jgi:hypothetical protein
MTTVESVLNRLIAVANRFPEWERPTFRPRAASSSIQELERTIENPLPSQFGDFLRRCDAIVAMQIHNGYWIGGVDNLKRSIIRGDYPATLDEDGLSMPVVPVATDGGGNAFLLTIGDGRIWRWDHETGVTFAVAGSFAEFLDRVATDWEQVISGNQDWTYLV